METMLTFARLPLCEGDDATLLSAPRARECDEGGIDEDDDASGGQRHARSGFDFEENFIYEDCLVLV